jgi:hypothetical protein
MKMELKPAKVKKAKGIVSQAKVEKQFEGDLEENISKGWGEKLQKIKEFEQKFKDRWKFEGDSEFYFSVCFKNKEDRDRFLTDNGIMIHDGNFIFADELPDAIIKS